MGIEEITELKESRDLVTDGKAVVTLDFNRVVRLGWIVFRNSYTASVTVRCRASSSDAWTTAVKAIPLMPHPHCIEGAQDPVAISYDMVAERAFDRVREIQLELRQPSPHWIKFGVSHLHCFSQPDERSAITTSALPLPLAETVVAGDAQSEIHALERTVTAVTSLVAAVAPEFRSVEGDHDSYQIDTLTA
eukprot:m.42113 g.42113  ORF g.42113 m.42113 type:complete len:191 (+) comp8285_c0_seq1:58-630(+)